MSGAVDRPEPARAADARSNHGLGPVSVVVCNYDGERYLDECLRAVERMRGDVGEVIVVDNRSNDRSVALVRERFPSVRVIEMGANDGPCPARNRGMREARHRYVLALDNDAVVREDTLEKLAAALVSREDVAIAQPRSVFASEPSRVHYDGGSFHAAGLIALRNFYRPIADAEGAGVVEVDCAVAVALLVDRDVLLELGGYDETMFILFEDLDLSFRLRACGRRIVSVEDALVLHKGGTPGISFREGPSYPGSRVFFHARNRWIYLAKCYEARTLVVLGPLLALYECAGLALALTQGGTAHWWRGKREFWRLRARWKADRATFHRARTLHDRDLLVGGPLTITPALAASTPKRLALRALDAMLTLAWRLLAWLLPRSKRR